MSEALVWLYRCMMGVGGGRRLGVNASILVHWR